ncbi:MAG: 3-deoxy-D-manno-octulosonic acid transferase [Gammaproteobacteria bacterium]|nr:3-deoxy-D-manno-octulosonic acid transferase [Gammaproteobacteria bacterium]
MISLYRLILWIGTPLIFAYTGYRSLKDGGTDYLRQRLGFNFPELKRAIWLHCASVGEVVAAKPLLELIIENCAPTPLVVTTNTPTGREVLCKTLGDKVHHVFLPLDYVWAVNRFCKHIDPRCALIFETELWPNLFQVCHRRGIPLVIINGRLTERTLNAPLVLRRLYAQGLGQALAILARSPVDRQRYISLGADPQRVTILGNIKFANLRNLVDLAPRKPLARSYWLAASTHDDEELRIAKIWTSIADDQTLLVIAPRHPDRREAILRQLKALKLRIAVRSRDETINAQTQVYLADTLGEMVAFMSHARLVFLGGSLIPRGGQNILEPARLGKAIIVGSHMGNFEEETRILLANDGLIMAHDDEELQHTIVDLLNDPQRRKVLGENAKNAIGQYADIDRRYFQKLQALGMFDDRATG